MARQQPRIVFGAEDVDQPSSGAVVFGAEDVTPPPATPPTPPPPAGGIGGFLTEATQGIHPANINAAVQAAFWHPIETVKGVVAAQDVPRQEAITAFQRGDYLTGSRKMVDWLIPVLGPRLDEAADLMQQGETARGLGAATDVGLTVATPQIVRGAVARLPTRAGTAAAAEGLAERQVTDVIAPTVGPEKIRLGAQAARVAPDVARRTTARTVGGLLDEAGENAARANQALDHAYSAIPASRPIPTQPVVAALQRAINQVRVRGAGGAMVTPATQAERVATLQRALEEVRALGPNATADQMRRLRIAWDEGAQAVFTPIMADNFRALRQAGHGWADARTALNEVIVGRHPELAPLNADVRLWTTLRDVLQATEEVERVRPRVGRTMLASAMTAGVGAQAGGAAGASMGALLGPLIDQAFAAASPAVKLTTARNLTRLADALRAGQPGQIRSLLGQISTVLPSAERTAFLTQALRLTRDVAPATPLAAEEAPARRPAAPTR